MKHPIRQETETAIMSDHQDNNAQEMTKSIEKMANFFAEESG